MFLRYQLHMEHLFGVQRCAWIWTRVRWLMAFIYINSDLSSEDLSDFSSEDLSDFSSEV